MASAAHNSILTAISLINEYNDDKAAVVYENENMLDSYEDSLGTYLVKISSKNLSEEDSQKVSKMLHVIGDFERLGDHAVNLLKTAKELYDKKISFSKQAEDELSTLRDALEEILDITDTAYQTGDTELAYKVEPLEQVIDTLVASARNSHIDRLRNKNCTIEMGFILSDILTNAERISDHCSNIAVAIIELSHNSFDTHKYLNAVKYGDKKFDEIYDAYKAKYCVE